MKKIILLLVSIAAVFALASCDLLNNLPFDIPGISGDETPDENENEGEDEGEGKVELDGIVLIEDGVANFRIVQSNSKGAPLRAKALADRLRSLGIEVEAPIGDGDAAKVSDCEIIFGADIRNREDCVVSSRYLGADGYVIKTVGNKIVVAGGSEKSLSKAYDLLLSQVLKITSKTKEGDIDDLAVKLDKEILKLTDYLIDSITVAGNDLAEYTLVLDTAGVGGSYSLDNVKGFREKLHSETGYWLELGTVEALDTYSHKLVIRYTDEPSGDDGEGFVAYVDDSGDLYFECAYANAFDTAFEKTVQKLIFGKMNDVTIPANYKETKRTAYVYYSDFGAKGDGKTDDFNALFSAHAFANECGQKVYGDEGAVYYINEDFTKEIIVQTDTDLQGATVRINDVGSIAYANRKHAIFHMARTNPITSYTKSLLDGQVGENRYIPEGATSIDWLAPLITTKSLVRIYNDQHRDFIRHGANENSGAVRTDIFVINPDGTLEEDCYVAYEFETVSTLNIWRTDDAPITFENGNFENICCRTVEETKFICKFHEYYRGFKVYRTNTTLKNIKHTMIDEPELNVTGTNDIAGTPKDRASQYGTRDESYPYYGFLYVLTSYNTTAEDMILDCHTTYYEDKPFTASTGRIPDPVAMGTYDLVIEYSSRTYLKNVVQQDNTGTGLADKRYWGIMSSNGSKNLFFTGCEINRFDAHRAFYNATLIDTTIGHSFNVIGGGKLYCENVTKVTGSDFMIFRKDYGATFNGEIELINCELLAHPAYNTAKLPQSFFDESTTVSPTYMINADYSATNEGAVVYEKDENGNDILDKIVKDGRYWNWDFGYTTYMPRKVTVENFVSGGRETYVFNNLPDEIFTDVPNLYQITKEIVFVGSGKVYPTCPAIDKAKKMADIKVTVK